MPEQIKNTNMTPVEKALADYEEIINEAQNFAKEKVLSEMDEKLNSIAMEFINKKKESVKTNVNESENKESTKVDKKKEMSDSKEDKINETLDLTNASINEIEAAFDNANSLDELEVVRDNFDMGSNGLDLDDDSDSSFETSSDEPNDEISIDDIKAELDSLDDEDDSDATHLENESVANNDPYEKIKKMHEELGGMLKEMETQMQETELKTNFNQKMSEMWGEGFEQKLGLEECAKMYEAWKTNQIPVDKGEEEVNQEDDKIVAEEEVDESHGISLAHNKKVGQEVQPRDGKEYAKNKFRIALQKESAEHAKKLAAVLKENKELNKKLNDLKSEKKQLTESNNKLSSLNLKMRDQMKDMAVFNTNIAYTNNLLMNESLSLSKEEKTKVINKFKNVKTITESENVYKTLIDEFKNKTINESTINDVLSAGVIISESNVKAIEKTAFENDPLAKMKRVIANIEKRK